MTVEEYMSKHSCLNCANCFRVLDGYSCGVGMRSTCSYFSAGETYCTLYVDVDEADEQKERITKTDKIIDGLEFIKATIEGDMTPDSFIDILDEAIKEIERGKKKAKEARRWKRKYIELKGEKINGKDNGNN